MPHVRPQDRTMWRALKSWLTSRRARVVSGTGGTVADMAAHIQGLLDAPMGSSLIVEVSGLEDAFLQFTAGPDRIQIDYPQITAGQVRREAALRKAFGAAGLTPYESRGSDGARFLDCDVPRDATGAAILVQRILESLFGVSASTELRFVGNGPMPAA